MVEEREIIKYIRLPDLLSELELSRIQGTYKNKIKQYEKCDLLILDEWLLVNTSNIEQQDILEVLEKRYRIHSTILCLYMTGGESHSVRYMRATTKPLVRATSSDKRASPYRLAS